MSINPKQMHHFTTTKDRFHEVRKKVLIAIISVYAIVIFIVLYLVNPSTTEAGFSGVYSLIFITPMIAFTTYRNLKRQQKMFETYRLTITDDAVIREQDNTPAITMPENSIKKIIRMSFRENHGTSY
jgi:hypothetical protein